MLTAQQRKAVAALLMFPSVEQAAASIKMSPQTIRRWLRENGQFRREYDSALQELIADAAASARQGMGEAVRTLREIMRNDEVPANVKATAARTMLESGSTLIELADLESRISDLENRMEDGADEREHL